MNMGSLYKSKVADNILYLKCIILCIMMVVVAYASEMPHKSNFIYSASPDSSLLSNSDIESPAIKSNPRIEIYEVIRSACAISESRTVTSRSELSFVSFILLLTAILLLVLCLYTPSIYRSFGYYSISIIRYIHDQDGLK